MRCGLVCRNNIALKLYVNILVFACIYFVDADKAIVVSVSG